MRRPLFAAIISLALSFLHALFVICARAEGLPDPGGVLKGLSVASFSGSGQNSIRAMATDAGGNIFVTGTTSSSDFPVKNAAQPIFGESRIMRTTDLGTTWTRVGYPPQDISVVVPDPVAPQVLFAAGDEGIYKSADGGQTWRQVYQFQSAFHSNGALVIDPGNHLRLAAFTPFPPPYGALTRSLDGGETWTFGWSTCSYPSCGQQLLADPTGSGMLLAILPQLSLSRDWGLTFQPITPPGSGNIGAVAFDPSNPGWIYAAGGMGTLGTLSLSTDFGATWTSKALPPTTFSAILYLAVDPDDPNTLIAATWDGLYKSSNGAASWTRQARSGLRFFVEENLPLALVSRRCSPEGGLFALGSGEVSPFYQVAFSPDYGVTWRTPQLTYVTNVTSGPDCAVYITRKATTDAFVAKLAPDGSTLWATFLGGSDQDVPVALALDQQGEVYIAGTTHSPNFPATVPRIGVPGTSSVFVTRFSADGALAYSILVGGDASNTAYSIAVDLGQNAYVLGYTSSLNFPTTPGALVTKRDSVSYTGFVFKLSTHADLVYSTYLGESYARPGAILVDDGEQAIIAGSGAAPGLPAPPQGTYPHFIVKLDRAASQVVSATYIQGTNSLGPSALATDGGGNLMVMGEAYTQGSTFPVIPGAYTSPLSPSGCAGIKDLYFGGGSIYVIKLRASDWQPIYRSLLTAPCGIQPGAMAVNRSGAVAFGVATGQGFPLHNPMLGGPTCSITSSAVAQFSADGSTLEFATYLDDCDVPAVAWARDGSLYAGVTHAYSGPTGVLHLTTTAPAPISLDRISNAFSGDAGAVVGGGLYTIEGAGFQPPVIGLGLNASQDLPLQLGGIQVKFDDVPAAILETSPGRVIVAPSVNLPALRYGGGGKREHSRTSGFTFVQLFYNGAPSNAVWMPVSASLPGLLTKDGLNPQPHTDFADGNVRNQDGSVNDAQHPAAVGSTITLFATGMGATNPPVTPGSIAHSAAVAPVIAVYSTWAHLSPVPAPPPPEAVSSMPGFVSALFQIRVNVTDSVVGPPAGDGFQRVPVGLLFQPQVYPYPTVSNLVGVYVK
jgi:uncharacterized protein (TIGR03437 family)